MMSHLAMLAALLLLVSSSSWSPFVGVSAMIDTDQSLHCAADDTFFSGWSFSFAEGGSYTLVALTLLPGPSWQHRNRTVQVMLATDAQLKPIRDLSMAQVCSHAPEVVWSAKLGGGPDGTSTARFHLPYTQRDWYRLLILNCAADTFDFRFSDIAVNPGGEYLSLSQVPYKSLFRTFVFIWPALIVLWGIHLACYRHWNISMQLALALLPLSKGALCVPNLLFWLHASNTGTQSRGLAWTIVLTETGERMVWAGVAWLLASGWRITQRAPNPVTQRVVLSLLGMIGLSYFVYSLWGGFLIFLVLISYILLLRIVFAALVESGTGLLRQVFVLQRADIDASQCKPLVDKMSMFKQLQVSVLIFLSIDVIFQLWAAIFLRATPWAGDAADQSLSTALVMVLCVVFRMKPFNPFYSHVVLAKLARNNNNNEAGAGAGAGAREDAGAAAAAAAAAGAGAEGQRNNDAAAAALVSSSSSAAGRGARHGGGGGRGERGDSYLSLSDDPLSSPSQSPHTSSSSHAVAAPVHSHSVAVYAHVPASSTDVTAGASATSLHERFVSRGGGVSDDVDDDEDEENYESRLRMRSSSLCVWRSVGPDGLWRPGCPAPPLELCMPSAAALGPEQAREEQRRERIRRTSGAGGRRRFGLGLGLGLGLDEFDAGGFAAAAAAADVSLGDEEDELPPVLVLENDDDGAAGSAPLLLGTLLSDRAESAASALLDNEAAAARREASVAAAAVGSAFGASAGIPPAALPFLPRSLRQQVAQQERMLEADARAAEVAEVARLVPQAASVAAAAASSNRSAPRRRADFPTYI
jgi:hypothetical protein